MHRPEKNAHPSVPRCPRQSDKRYFLDQTPQYHLIIPELLRVFPAASYVILFRNPLAVLVSMIAAWVPDDFSGCRAGQKRICSMVRAIC